MSRSNGVQAPVYMQQYHRVAPRAQEGTIYYTSSQGGALQANHYLQYQSLGLYQDAPSYTHSVNQTREQAFTHSRPQSVDGPAYRYQSSNTATIRSSLSPIYIRHTQPYVEHVNQQGYQPVQQMASDAPVPATAQSSQVSARPMSARSSRHVQPMEDFTGMRQQFRSKTVCLLSCVHCDQIACNRGMKAILLADTKIELFSTDIPPQGVQLVHEDYQTRNCFCRIRDVACLGCGNVIGYHVTQPCEPCMEACNNGHFWMFHIDQVKYSTRLNAQGTKELLWANLPRPEKDAEKVDVYEKMCR